MFTFDKIYPIGEIHACKHEEDTFEIRNVLKPDVCPEALLSDSAFVNLHEQLSPLEQPQMQAKKQWDLYEKVRPYVPVEYQDIVCPQPKVDKKCTS